MQRPRAHAQRLQRLSLTTKQGNTQKSGITPDQHGHQPQCPYAQGWTCAKQEWAQAVALGL